MEFKKAKIEGHMVNVVSVEEFEKNKDLYDTDLVAVEVEKKDGEKYVLPYRPENTTHNRPGVYPTGNKSPFDLIVYPRESEKEDYQPEVVDLSNAKSMQDFISKQGKLKEIEKEILTTPDNIFKPHIDEEDSPLMKALKTAIIQKHIDIDKYSDGYGSNFPNDKRKLKEHDISMRLAERHFEILGIKAELVLSDQSPDVPNPLGTTIRIPLTYAENETKEEDDSGGN